MKAVLYSLWTGILTKTEGYIESGAAYRNFYVVLRNGSHSRRTVSPLEGSIYNKCLWLKEANDEFAKKAFIEYEKNCIEDLQKRIEAHKKLINILENEEIKS